MSKHPTDAYTRAIVEYLTGCGYTTADIGAPSCYEDSTGWTVVAAKGFNIVHWYVYTVTPDMHGYAFAMPIDGVEGVRMFGEW